MNESKRAYEAGKIMMQAFKRGLEEGEKHMERLTTYHAGKAVIKDKSRLSEAMEKLARYEDWEENEHRIFRALPVKDEIGLINGDYLIVSDTIQKDDVIEKTVFLTFEDAKKAVEKLKNTQGIEVNDYDNAN